MPEVRKSCSCEMSTIQCCFMIEAEVLMIVSDFSGFFLGTISGKGASFFNTEGGFRLGASFLSGGLPHGGHRFWWGGFEKKCSWWGWGAPHVPPCPLLWETLIHLINITRLEVLDSFVEIYHYRFGFYAQCTPFWVKQFFQILESVSK